MGEGRVSVGTMVAGLVAGMGYGMMEMIIEAIGGKGFWSPLRFIASVFTLGSDTDPSFAVVPVFVGLMGHMMNSVLFGIVFAVFLSRIAPGTVGQAITGMMYAAAIFVAMWFVVLPRIDRAMLLLNPIGFFASHLMYGLLLGVGIAYAHRREGSHATTGARAT